MDITSTLQDYHLLGLVIGICTFLVHRTIPSRSSEMRIPLRHIMLVVVSAIGLRMHHSVADRKRHPRLYNTRSGGIFIILDDKGDIRAAGACKERLVST